MIAHLSGDHETVDYSKSRSFLLYDNIENENYPMHWHNAIEIIMPLVNDYTVECGKTTFELNERDVLLIPAGELHAPKGSPGRRIIFICDNDILTSNPALCELEGVLCEPILVNKNHGEEFLNSVNKHITDIYTMYFNYKELSEVYIYIKLLSLLAMLKEFDISALSYIDEANADKFRFIVQYIDQNYMNNISLESLAKLAGYSKYYFSRLFKKDSPYSFIDLVNRRRIKAATVKLIENDLSISDIAMQSGFSSITTFNRIFKEIKGCTPTEFKRMYDTPEVLERYSK